MIGTAPDQRLGCRALHLSPGGDWWALFAYTRDEYRPRQSRSTPLFRLLDSHYEEFRNVYDERFAKRYGFWRHVTDEVVEKYLQCGDPHFGFARIRCKVCRAEYLRAFSCKCRGFCPSCSKRKSLDLAIFLEEELFKSVPHRHWVWSVPKMLRLHFLHHRRLLPNLWTFASDCTNLPLAIVFLLWGVLIVLVKTIPNFGDDGRS